MADAPETPDTTTKPDYRSTVFLPRTDFPMKAGLPQKEPTIAARWESEGLYRQLREARAGRSRDLLDHGGHPPFSTGLPLLDMATLSSPARLHRRRGGALYGSGPDDGDRDRPL